MLFPLFNNVREGPRRIFFQRAFVQDEQDSKLVCEDSLQDFGLISRERQVGLRSHGLSSHDNLD